MPDSIVIPTDRMRPAIMAFVESSALRFCTTFGYTEHDAVEVVPSWPVEGFSAGEAVAWSLLCSLVNGDLRAAFERLDASNVAALMSTLNELHGQLVTP
jgi:hypothetical protein